MLRHYFTFALRNLWRNKFHAFINISGLAIGVSACLVIYLIVTFELSYNRGIPDYDRIYRIHSKFSGSFSGLNRGVPTAVASYVKDNFKGVDNVAMFFGFASDVQVPLKTDRKKFDDEREVIITGEAYFKLFTFYRWVAGSSAALTKPNQVVLLEAQAKKYFGDMPYADIVGKQIIYRDSIETTVGGIVASLNMRTDLDFTDFISLPTIEASSLKRNFALDDWASTNSGTQIFVKAQQGATHQQLTNQLPLLSKIYNEKNTWAKNDFNVQPLSGLHFDAETGIFDNSRSPANKESLYALAVVAVLLLIIGSINFINLETAQAVRRAKEVGLRKVMGSSRLRLVFQFVSESLVLTFISIILAVPLTELALKLFAEFVPPGVGLNLRDFVPFLFIVVLVIGLLASAYPALVLSSFTPALALKNQVYVGSSQSLTVFLRKLLIIFQFTFAQALIIGTLVVGWQIRFLLTKDLGFKQEAVIYFTTPWWEKQSKVSVLKNELDAIPDISEMSLSNQPPAYNGWSSSMIEFANGKENLKVNTYRKFGDSSYIRFYGMKLLAGRNLSHSDSMREIVINETLMRNLGIQSPEKAIGENILFGKKNIPIVGVVKDFNFQSLHHAVEPVMMSNTYKDFSCFNIKLKTTRGQEVSLKESLDKVEAAWKKIYPDQPFHYAFLEETIRNFYQTEQRTEKLTRTAMSLAVFISCLGLFGLASYSCVQRTKEIGVRKVLGATASQILFLLSRDFMLLVIISFVAASPLAWYGINQWLQGFPYHTNVGVWMFAATIVLAVIVAFVTVSFQTVKTANLNPVDTLRNE